MTACGEDRSYRAQTKPDTTCSFIPELHNRHFTLPARLATAFRSSVTRWPDRWEAMRQAAR